MRFRHWKGADEPKIEPGKVTNYDPLESDSAEYGREFFLGDLNRYLLNKRMPPSNPILRKFHYSVETWKTAPQLAETFASLLDASGVTTDWVDFATLHMCFTLDHAAAMARCVGNLALQKYRLAYIDACAGLDGALKLQYPEGIWRSAMYKAIALQELGFIQRAKKALEPALRLAPQELEVSVLHQSLALEKKDEPKIDAALLDNIDPLAGEGFAYEKRRKIYPALLRAMEKIYYEEPGPYWPSTSIHELEWYIINEAHRALRTRKCTEAAFLFSTVINVSDRKEFYLLTNRAQVYLWIPASKLHYKAYIDASEAFKLDPTFRTALFFKATALTKLGFIERARQCFRQMRQIDPRDDEVHQLLAQVAGVPDRPLIDEKKLEKYDPQDADESIVEDDGLEQQIDAVRYELQAAMLLQLNDTDAALKLLERAVERRMMPGTLCLRARALLKAGRFLDAFAYAVRAAKTYPTFLEAVELKGQCLAAMGFFTKAHVCLRDVLKCDPKNDDVKQLLGSIKNERDRPTEDPSSIAEIEEE
ncbi:hypothetical protein AAVH_11855 [Aphelenchoides avenae]|nr:hypothetical protein AAVH_11855 [Aphelenchus avenae]